MRLIQLFLMGACLTCCSSCAAIGVLGQAVQQNVRAKYTGLAGQSVGVMVWADQGIMMDWGTISLDLANSVEQKLSTTKTDETKGITFPYHAASYVRYQRDHPSMQTMPITDVAPALGVSRLVYIEVHQFGTRSASEMELFRGEASASLKIIEIDSSSSARVAYSEDNIRAVFPKGVNADGEPSLGDGPTYSGTIDTLAQNIVDELTTHEVQDEHP